MHYKYLRNKLTTYKGYEIIHRQYIKAPTILDGIDQIKIENTYYYTKDNKNSLFFTNYNDLIAEIDNKSNFEDYLMQEKYLRSNQSNRFNEYEDWLNYQNLDDIINWYADYIKE